MGQAGWPEHCNTATPVPVQNYRLSRPTDEQGHNIGTEQADKFRTHLHLKYNQSIFDDASNSG